MRKLLLISAFAFCLFISLHAQQIFSNKVLSHSFSVAKAAIYIANDFTTVKKAALLLQQDITIVTGTIIITATSHKIIKSGKKAIPVPTKLYTNTTKKLNTRTMKFQVPSLVVSAAVIISYSNNSEARENNGDTAAAKPGQKKKYLSQPLVPGIYMADLSAHLRNVKILEVKFSEDGTI